MLARFTIFIVFIFLASTFSSGQNLVLNPSFEELRNLPVKKNPKRHFRYELKSGYIPYIKNLKYWFAGSQTTPDLRIFEKNLYNECKRKFKTCDHAHSGKNCVGLMTFMQNSKHETYREYVQIKLKEKLKPNIKTYVEFWITKEREAKLVSNNIGCFFAKEKTYVDTKETIDVKPQINFDTIINSEVQKWVKLETTFYPEQAFEFLLIGNFFKNENTKLSEFKNFNGSAYTPPYAYYLIDDFRIWQEGAEKVEVLIFKNDTVKTNTPIRLKNIEFDFDRSTLRPISFVELEKLLNFMNENPEIKIKIQGHTDHKGEPDYNQLLSEDRAKSVVNYLIENGIQAHRLIARGFGETSPIDTNFSEEGRSRNRRVEFLILEK